MSPSDAAHPRQAERGVAALEFVLMLPLLLTIFFGIVEFARFALINQKLDKLVHSMADFATQSTTISSQELAAFTGVANQIMTPFGFSGTIIFSSVVNSASSPLPCTGKSSPCISWQGKCLGAANSNMGGAGNVAANFPLVGMATGQNVIVAEVFYNYGPLASYTGQIMSSLGAQTLYKIAVYKPRQGDLITIQSNGGGCTVIGGIS